MLGAATHFVSLRATHRLWRDERVTHARRQHQAQAMRAKGLWVDPPFARRGGDHPSEAPPVRERQARLWVRRPFRVRLEHDDFVLVVEGERWWEGVPSRRFYVSGQDEAIVRGTLELQQVAFLLDPSGLARVAGLSLAGHDTVAGRTAIRVRSPIPADPDRVLWPGIGWASFSTEYELWIDAERGVLLRAVERFKGADYAIAELVDAEFDVSIADDLFRVLLPPGERFRDYEEILPRRLSLEEAARQVPFSVFVPESVPQAAGAWDGQVAFEPLLEWIRLSYLDPVQRPRTRLQISESRSGPIDGNRDQAGYGRVERGGQTMLVREEQSEDGEWHSVVLEREGTRITIDAMLDREATIGIALSLKPVPAG